MRKIVIPIGVLLALVFGAVALAHTGPTGQGGRPDRLERVLADLVRDGTITRGQSASIVSALAEERPCKHHQATESD